LSMYSTFARYVIRFFRWIILCLECV
jgi:hypothetical protein